MAHVIQNFERLAESSLRRDALTIAEAGYAAINVKNILFDSLRIEDSTLLISRVALDKRYRLAGRSVFSVCIGKCAVAAATAIEEILGDTLTSGIAFDVSNHGGKLKKIEVFVGTHPLPSEKNAEVTKYILKYLSERTENDLVIMLISGGGSALLSNPETPMTIGYESELFKKLTAKGATIQELNTVRKHLSRARGGGLARAAYPAEVLSLIVSDVPGDDIAFISSGPTVLDTSTVAEAEAVLNKYNTVLLSGALVETPKEQKYFERVANLLFLSAKDALSAMRDEASRLGYTTEVVNMPLSGESSEIGKSIVEKLHTMAPHTALLCSGESTVSLGESRGTGGRNQELALSSLEQINDDELVLSFSSDGHDNTDHAGAIADTLSREHARIQNLLPKDYLDLHNSYSFFSATNDYLLTGYTGSNVSDLIVALKNN